MTPSARYAPMLVVSSIEGSFGPISAKCGPRSARFAAISIGSTMLGANSAGVCPQFPKFGPGWATSGRDRPNSALVLTDVAPFAGAVGGSMAVERPLSQILVDLGGRIARSFVLTSSLTAWIQTTPARLFTRLPLRIPSRSWATGSPAQTRLPSEAPAPVASVLFLAVRKGLNSERIRK